MKKILVLSLISLFACNAQVFSEENKEYDRFEVGNFEKYVNESPSDNTVDNFRRSFNKLVLSNKSYDVKNILDKFREWSNTKIKEIEMMNPEMLTNINVVVGYLLGAAKQTKEDNSKLSSVKGWENLFSDAKKAITRSKKSSNHEMLYVFMYAFSSSPSNAKEEKDKMRRAFMKTLLENASLKNEFVTKPNSNIKLLRD